jgi:hypothetical protein
MPGLSKSETARLLTHIEPQGVKVTPVKNGYMLRLPDGGSTTVHLSVSDHRGPANLRARLKRAGVTWPTDPDVRPTLRARTVITDALNALGHPESVKPAAIREQFHAAGWENVTNGTIRRAMTWAGYVAAGHTHGLVWVRVRELVDEIPDVVEPAPVVEPPAVPDPLAGTAAALRLLPQLPTQWSTPGIPAPESEWVVSWDDLPPEFTIENVRLMLMALGLDSQLKVWRTR